MVLRKERWQVRTTPVEFCCVSLKNTTSEPRCFDLNRKQPYLTFNPPQRLSTATPQPSQTSPWAEASTRIGTSKLMGPEPRSSPMRGDSSADSARGLSGGFPILGVPCLGVPIIRTIVYWVYVGVPLFWETAKLI